MAAYVLLDGADIAFLHLILGCAADEVRMGMRVGRCGGRARSGAPRAENINHFRPTGEPDAPYETYARITSDRAWPSSASRSRPVGVREDATTDGVEMLVPVFAEVLGATGLTKRDIGFWCSGSSDYLAGRAFSFVAGARRDRRRCRRSGSRTSRWTAPGRCTRRG